MLILQSGKRVERSAAKVCFSLGENIHRSCHRWRQWRVDEWQNGHQKNRQRARNRYWGLRSWSQRALSHAHAMPEWWRARSMHSTISSCCNSAREATEATAGNSADPLSPASCSDRLVLSAASVATAGCRLSHCGPRDACHGVAEET